MQLLPNSIGNSSKKLKLELPYGPRVSFWVIYPTEVKWTSQRDFWTLKFYVIIHNIQNCLLAEKWRYRDVYDLTQNIASICNKVVSLVGLSNLSPSPPLSFSLCVPDCHSVEVKGQFACVFSSSTTWVKGLNSDSQAWRQMIIFAEPFHYPVGHLLNKIATYKNIAWSHIWILGGYQGRVSLWLWGLSWN